MSDQITINEAHVLRTIGFGKIAAKFRTPPYRSFSGMQGYSPIISRMIYNEFAEMGAAATKGAIVPVRLTAKGIAALEKYDQAEAHVNALAGVRF